MERAAFEQLARLDREHWWLRGRRAVYLGLLERALAGRKPARLLDLGCGPGGFLPGLSRIAERVIAADADLESLRAQPGGPRVLGAAERLPFADATIDVACCFDVIEHLDDDVAALREVRRVLAPGGLVLLSVPAYPWLFSNNDRIAMHRRRYTRRRLASALEQAGLEVMRNTHANVLLTPLIVPVVLLAKAWEGLGLARADSQRTNLSFPLPRVAHGVLARVFACELAFTRRFDAPFGHSIVALARKR